MRMVRSMKSEVFMQLVSLRSQPMRRAVRRTLETSMKRYLLLATLLPVICALATAPLGAQEVVRPNEPALRDTLVGIYLDFAAGWEPQSGSEQNAIARARKYFVTDSTFDWLTTTAIASVTRLMAAAAQWREPSPLESVRLACAASIS